MTQQYIRISYRIVIAFFLGVALSLSVFMFFSSAGASVAGKSLLAVSSPPVVSYQGTIEVSGSSYDGAGFFKFAVVDVGEGDGSTNYWSNDGTASGEPSQTVPLTVTNGLFDVMLGDTGISGMTEVLGDLAFSSTSTYLRVWFSQGSNGPFEALEPNQRIGSVPYALRAKYAETGPSMVPSGAVIFFDDTSCPSGWTELTGARGRTVVGLPNGGTLKGTRGTALSDRENRGHNHSVNPDSFSSGVAGSHQHSTDGPSSTGDLSFVSGGVQILFGADDHTHTTTNAGAHNHSVDVPSTTSSDATTSSVMPYIQLLACAKD